MSDRTDDSLTCDDSLLLSDALRGFFEDDVTEEDNSSEVLEAEDEEPVLERESVSECAELFPVEEEVCVRGSARDASRNPPDSRTFEVV